MFQPTTSRARYKFESSWEYLMITIANTFTVNNLYTFDIVHLNDQEPTIIHYITSYIIVGLPLNYIQVIIGQYSQLGVIFFKYVTPIGHGIGYVFLVNSLMHCIILGIIMSDFSLYFLACLRARLEWMVCPEEIKDNCWGVETTRTCKVNCISENTVLSSVIFWRDTFLRSTMIDLKGTKFGLPNLGRATTLCGVWTILFVILKSTIDKFKKVVRINLYVIGGSLMVLMLVCILTKGSIHGMQQMFNINPGSLINLGAWSLGVFNAIELLALNRVAHTMYGSYMSPKMSSGVLTIFSVLFNLFLTIFGSFFTYGTFGVVMKNAGIEDKPFEYIWRSSFTPLYTVVPQGLGFSGVPQLWTAMFFLTCILLTANNIITQMDAIERTISDAHSRFRSYRIYMLATFCFISALVGVFFVSESALHLKEVIYDHILKLTDCFHITVTTILLFWVYQVQRLSDDIHFFIGSQPAVFWKICWYLAPMILILTFINLSYEHWPSLTSRDNLLYFLFISPLPVLAIYEIFRFLRNHNLVGLCQPEERWGPPDPQERHLRHLFNPREEVRSRRRNDACHHKCFIKSKFVKKAVQDEFDARLRYEDQDEKYEEEVDDD